MRCDQSVPQNASTAATASAMLSRIRSSTAAPAGPPRLSSTTLRWSPTVGGGSARLDEGEAKPGPPQEHGGSARLDEGEPKLGPPQEHGGSARLDEGEAKPGPPQGHGASAPGRAGTASTTTAAISSAVSSPASSRRSPRRSVTAGGVDRAGGGRWDHPDRPTVGGRGAHQAGGDGDPGRRRGRGESQS